MRVTVDDASDDVREVELRVDGVEFAGLDERGDRGPVPAAFVGACKERILAVQGDWFDRTLDDVGIDLDPSVVEEAAKTRPAANTNSRGSVPMRPITHSD